MPIYDKARELARLLAESEEYVRYKRAKEAAMADNAVAALIKQYHQLQLQAQAAMMANTKDEAAMESLRRVGEFLQFNPAAAEFLMAEYALSRMLGDIYKILGESIEVDLSMLEG
jgi:cell fate (sporulation/competence/biofilm development) regulator YlbF (YheA/YmcA/DUF963 family)